MRKRNKIVTGIGTLLLLAGVGGLGVRFYEQRSIRMELERLPELLAIKPGVVVGEIGAGKGEMAKGLAVSVGPGGRILATEIDAKLLRELRSLGVANLTVIEAGERETRLPAGCCDAVYMRKVYHHFSDPAAIAADLYRAVRPGGWAVVIDFPPRWWLGGHGVRRERVVEGLTRAGFVEARSMEEWPGLNYCVVLRRPG